MPWQPSWVAIRRRLPQPRLGEPDFRAIFKHHLEVDEGCAIDALSLVGDDTVDREEDIVFLGCRCGSLVAIVGWRSSSDSDDGVKWPEIGGFVGTAPSLSGEMGADGDSATISPGGLGAVRQLKDFQD